MLTPDQLQLLTNFQSSVNGGDQDYNPDVFEYDDEQAYGEQGEKVILDENFNEKGTVKTLGIMSKVPRSVLVDMQDDEDALI